jgi:Skp family chaperone for outer membrane proteins
MPNLASRPWTIAALGALAALGVSYVATKATAVASLMAPPSAPVIAVVDLEECLKQLNEKGDKERALKSQVDTMQGKVNQSVEDLKSDQTKLEAMPNNPAKIEAAKAFREKMIRAEFEKQYSQRLLNEMQSEMLRDLYVKIAAAAADIAKRNNYDLVMASDAGVPIPPGADIEGVTRAIALKRMLYVGQNLDITAEVVQAMNNQYAAGGSSSAPPAGNQPKPATGGGTPGKR